MTTHILKEDNDCVYKLVSYGVVNVGYIWWDLLSSFIGDDFRGKR